MQDIAKEWRSVRPLGSASAPAPTRLANVSPSGLTRPATSPGQFNTTRVVRDQGAAARVGAVRTSEAAGGQRDGASVTILSCCTIFMVVVMTPFQTATGRRPLWAGILDWIQAHPTTFLLLVFVAIAGALTLRLASRGRLGVPPGRGDGVGYDNIAFNLAQGHGFSVDWDNPEWRQPYEQHNSNHDYDYLLARTGRWRTTFRPPAFPLLIAGNQVLFGRQFVTVRITNVLFLAGALCLVAALASRLIGPLCAVLVPALGLADRHTLAYSGAIMTESLALFAVVLLIWLLARLLDRPSGGNAALAGAALGFALLGRSIFILWYPLLAVAVFLLVSHAQPSRNTRRALALAALFLAVAVAVPAPWGARNCIVLGTFMPLGTQGGMTLAGGYSDAAWRSGKGNWVQAGSWGLYASLERSEPYRALPGHLQERERARAGAEYASEWIKRNPEKIPVLAWRRLRDLMRPRDGYDAALLTLALGGLLSRWRDPLVRLLAGLVAINALAVMAACSAHARYLFPVRGCLYVLAAVGLVSVGRWLAAQSARRPTEA